MDMGERDGSGAPKLIGSDTTKHGGEGRRPGRSREARFGRDRQDPMQVGERDASRGREGTDSGPWGVY